MTPIASNVLAAVIPIIRLFVSSVSPGSVSTGASRPSAPRVGLKDSSWLSSFIAASSMDATTAASVGAAGDSCI